MSTILYSPPAIDVKFDPGLEYITKQEQTAMVGNISGPGDTTPNLVLEQITNNITNVIHNDPSDSVLDLVDLNHREYVPIAPSVTATIVTGDPQYSDRVVRLASPRSMMGRRMIMINRSETHYLIIQDDELNTIVVVDNQSSEEILSDGYNWITVN